MVSVKRRRLTASLGGSFEELALQPHQITGTADPHIPIRLLMNMAPDFARPAKAAPKKLAKLKGPEIGRLVNEQLAPGKLN